MGKTVTNTQKQSKKSFPEGDKGSESGLQNQFFTRLERLIIVIIFFAAAFYIRIYHIDDPPLIFHPNRQYHSAMIARAFYFEHCKTIQPWQREMAILNRSQEVVGELPILEFIASIAYRIAGGEYLWIPRLLNVVFWLIGGLCLYLFVGRISSFDGAILSLGYFLFLPYAIEASRSFQPNPLMIMLLIISITTIYGYYEKSTRKHLFIAAAVSALTLFIYPTSVFPLMITFGLLAIYRKGIWGTLKDWQFWVFGSVCVLPAAAYYFYAIFIAGHIRGYSQTAFLPKLLLESFFWKGWLTQIDKVIGLAGLIGGLLGLFLFPDGLTGLPSRAQSREGRAKVLLCGLFLSYVIYAFIFTYHIHTHDYYQLPFVPTVAISLGAVGAAVLNRFGQINRNFFTKIGVSAVILFAVFINVCKQKEQLYNRGIAGYVKMCEEIGAIVEHSKKTIFLTYSYGKPLRYHGQIAGSNWPDSGDFRADILSGIPIVSAQERYKQLSKDGAEFFIITEFSEFEYQQDLKKFLTQNFSLLANNQNYLIFDLRKGLQK
jgi:hypothetical protein